MFTGLVEGTGGVVGLERRGPDIRLRIRADFEISELRLGESVAVDGVCLTVVAFAGPQFEVDVSQETLTRTTLGSKRIGDRVNLERALRLGERLGGHLVSGHVDGRGVLTGREKRGASLLFRFRAPEEICRYLIPKGSVAVDGVSLTVNSCDSRGFEVNLIPHTAAATTLGGLQPGTEVNIEVDLIGKYVEKFVRPWGAREEKSESRLDRDFLARHGFL